MAKRMRRKAAAKAPKRTKAARKTKRAASKTRRKTATPKKLKAAAPTKPQAPAPQAQPATKPSGAPRESLAHRIGGAFKAVVDTLSDAERLHHQLDPDPTKGLDLE
jgi:hypothetical protein